MMHFSAVLFVAFAFLVVNKFVNLGDVVSGDVDGCNDEVEQGPREYQITGRNKQYGDDMPNDHGALVCKFTGI